MLVTKIYILWFYFLPDLNDIYAHFTNIMLLSCIKWKTTTLLYLTGVFYSSIFIQVYRFLVHILVFSTDLTPDYIYVIPVIYSFLKSLFGY
jgi:hypothetical protein